MKGNHLVIGSVETDATSSLSSRCLTLNVDDVILNEESRNHHLVRMIVLCEPWRGNMAWVVALLRAL